MNENKKYNMIWRKKNTRIGAKESSEEEEDEDEDENEEEHIHRNT